MDQRIDYDTRHEKLSTSVRAMHWPHRCWNASKTSSERISILDTNHMPNNCRPSCLLKICTLIALLSTIEAPADELAPPGLASTESEVLDFLDALLDRPELLASTTPDGRRLCDRAFLQAARFVDNEQSAVPVRAIITLLPANEWLAVHLAEMRVLSLWPKSERELSINVRLDLAYCLMVMRDHPRRSSLEVLMTLMHRHKVPNLSAGLRDDARHLVDVTRAGQLYQDAVELYQPVVHAPPASEKEEEADPDAADREKEAMEEYMRRINENLQRQRESGSHGTDPANSKGSLPANRETR